MDPKQTKTLLVSNAVLPKSGGFPKTMRKFAVALDAGIVSFTSPHERDEETSAFPEVLHVPTGKNSLAEWYAYAGSAARRPAEAMAAHADLISCHIMLRYQANWVRKIARKHDIPYWFVPHGQLDPHVYTYRSGIKRLWLNLYGGPLLRDAAHVIFSTEREREKAKWFYDGPNTRVVHWPVDLINVEAKAEMRACLRKRLGLSEKAKVFLFLGRLHSGKRPLATITALALSKVKDAHLIMIGPEYDVSPSECMKHAGSLGIANNVHILGASYGEDKEMYLLGADSYISLSVKENFGHTAAESLSAGIPVILSPGNDLSPELEPHKCGWFLETDEVTEAANAIACAATVSDQELKRMGEQGRCFVRDECSEERFNLTLRSLREEALYK
jgi:glycosyltransferase involved in cell wall biosynthesis